MVIVDIYLPNILKKRYNELEKFLLVGMEQDIKKAIRYAGDDVELVEFVKVGKEKSKDKDLLEAYNKEEAIADLYYRNGKTEGRTEGIKEIAKKLLTKGMSTREIIDITGLSEKEIKSLKK